MKHAVGLLGFRYGLLILVWFWWLVYNRDASNLSSNQNSSDANQKITSVILYMFNNLRGMPVLIGLGFYKLLPNKDFRCEILIGYAIEATTSTIAMLSVQFNNNSSTVGSLTWIQVTSLSLRFLSILLFIFELVIFGWESLINFKMRNTNIRRYKRLSTQQRVEVYGNRHAKITLGGLIVSSIIIIFGIILVPGRECLPSVEGGPRKVLNWGVCTDCPANCQTCTGVDKCNICTEGHYLSADHSECLDCDSDSKNTLCKECTAPNMEKGSTPVCQSCAEGFHLDPETATCRTCE